MKKARRRMGIENIRAYKLDAHQYIRFLTGVLYTWDIGMAN